jgi:hypothetical protein
MELKQYGHASVLVEANQVRFWRHAAIARISGGTGLWVELSLVSESVDRPSRAHSNPHDERPWQIITTKVGQSIPTLHNSESSVSMMRHGIAGDDQHSVLEYVFNLPEIQHYPPHLEFSYKLEPIGLNQMERLEITQP